MIKLRLKLSKSTNNSLITTKKSSKEALNLDIIDITIRLKNTFHSKFIDFFITKIEIYVLIKLIIRL